MEEEKPLWNTKEEFLAFLEENNKGNKCVGCGTKDVSPGWWWERPEGDGFECCSCAGCPGCEAETCNPEPPYSEWLEGIKPEIEEDAILAEFFGIEEE